jgi:hypothetical protein
MRRKIVQLAATHWPEEDVDEGDALFALCDDGSVWLHHWRFKDHPEGWERLADIPQDCPE